MNGDRPAKILVVDDLAAQRMALAAALAALDEDVITVGSGPEALRLLLESDVAVILLDVNMPDMDGFETAELIRQRPRTRHTPIIFLTADTDEMLLPRAYALGAVDFILNPVLPEILRAKVRVFVELSKLHERVRREADQRIAVAVEVDAVRTEQVITNILTNAVKYTDPGGRIDVDLLAEDTHAVVRVQDTGIGMSREMLQRLFQPFSQEHQALDRARGGLGLGLTLVRRLVELQDGHVEARSEGPGRGSTFTVRLPRAPGVAPPRPARPGSRPSVPALRILIVEDNDDAREMRRVLLALAGHETYEASDGLEGVRVAGEIKPQVVLVDLGLPGLDGLEVASRIRSRPNGADMLLVAVTGYGRTADREKTRQAGFDLHVVKPVDPEVLRDVLARAGATPFRTAAR